MAKLGRGLLDAVLVGAITCGLGNCSAKAKDKSAGEVESARRAAVDDAGNPGGVPGSGEFRFDASLLGSERWVTRHDPEKAWSGYTLLLLWRRVPALVDMNGTVVHAWPGVQAMGRARLTKEGHLLFQDKTGPLRMITWDGEPVWSYERGDGDFSHHDVVRLANGDVASIWRDTGSALDYLQEVDPSGRVLFTWKMDDYFRNALGGKSTDPNDPTHVNSVQEIPPNRHWDAGDARFRPGNLLVSARHLNRVFVVDKTSGEVVWSFSKGLAAQHEALMIEKGYPREGDIILFNNDGNSSGHSRQSSVWVIDPVRGERVWEYTDEYFYSSGGGVAQQLPNGDVMIASSRGGRIFEVDEKGEIVWQMETPYLPMRPSRYAPDFCPQLAALPGPKPREVGSAGAPRYVSRDLYDLVERNEYGSRRLGDADYQVLKPSPGGAGLRFAIAEDGAHEYCRDVVVPADAELSFGYALDAKSDSAPGGGPLAVEFTVRLREEGGRSTELYRDIVGTAAPAAASVRTRDVDLAGVAFARGQLCFGAKASVPCDDARLESLAVWLPPRLERKRIKAMNYRGLFKKMGLGRQKLDPVLQEKLKALGYVD